MFTNVMPIGMIHLSLHNPLDTEYKYPCLNTMFA